MANAKRVGLVGATGYTGMELLRLLAGHPGMALAWATSRTEAGKRVKDIHPFLDGTRVADAPIVLPEPGALAENCDLAFLAVPHGAAQEVAASLLEAGLKVVDLSADFRLRDKEVYEAWYAVPHTQPGPLAKAVFGLPELYADAVRGCDLTANPGCYPTSAILGLAPALAMKLVKPHGIVIDAKSGATGAGRKASQALLFCEVADSFRAYNLGKHRHTPEIEQELSKLAGEDILVSFNTHLLPMGRGILSTIYTELASPMDTALAVARYRDFYAGKPWVRVLDPGKFPETRHVRGTMFCDIGLTSEPRTGRLIVTSAIDNLCRGASGQALANANLMLGLDPEAGLDMAPLMP